MKKYLILLLIIFISCGSPESLEEEIVSLEEEIVSLEEEIVSLEEEDNNKPDSSSEDQQEASSETNLFIGEIIQDNTFIDFHRYIDVGGLRIFALSDVSGEFILEVAEVYSLMFGENEYIDSNLRNRYIETTEKEFVFQRIGYIGPENYNLDSLYPDVDCCPGKNYRNNHTDYIWEYPNVSANDQTGEVIEHLLHTITGVGFAKEFSEWNWDDTNSKIHLAMDEAIEKNIYDISDYEEIRSSGRVKTFNRITVQEFSFWVIVTAWGYGDIFDLPHGEFMISTVEELKESLPLAYELYKDTVEKILTPPDKNYLRAVSYTHLTLPTKA